MLGESVSYLAGEESLLRASGDLLLPLLGGDLVLVGELLCLLLSAAADGGWCEWRSLWRGEELRRRWGLGALLWCGERFSFPDDVSLDGDLPGLLSRSFSASERPGRPSLERLLRPRELDLRLLLLGSAWCRLSSGRGDDRLSDLPFPSTRLSEGDRLCPAGDKDFLGRSLERPRLRERFLSLDPLRSFPRSLFVSLPLAPFVTAVTDAVAFSALASRLLLSLDLLRRLEPGLPESLKSLRLLPERLPWSLGERALPELIL